MSEESEKITIRLPKSYLTTLDFLVRADDFPSRSEAIRTAVRDMIYGRIDLVMEKIKKLQELREKMVSLQALEEEILKK
jgi:Arc/MetJ-type ribon-helix-helix transcriptional regulator